MLASFVVVDVFVDWHVDWVRLGDGDLNPLFDLNGVRLFDIIRHRLFDCVRYGLLYNLGDDLEIKKIILDHKL